MMSPQYVVGSCPVDYGDIFALRSEATGAVVFHAPCCGLAWPGWPDQGWDEIDDVQRATLLAIAPTGVSVATWDDLCAAGLSSRVVAERHGDQDAQFLREAVDGVVASKTLRLVTTSRWQGLVVDDVMISARIRFPQRADARWCCRWELSGGPIDAGGTVDDDDPRAAVEAAWAALDAALRERPEFVEGRIRELG